MSKKYFVYIYKTKIFINILNFLWKKAFILGYSCHSKKIKIYLKYSRYFKSSLNYILILKTNLFLTFKNIWQLKQKNLLLVLKTIYGLKTLFECRKQKIGGKLIFIIF